MLIQYKSKYSITFRFIAIVIVCLFLIQDIAYAVDLKYHAQISMLAAPSMFCPAAEWDEAGQTYRIIENTAIKIRAMQGREELVAVIYIDLLIRQVLKNLNSMAQQGMSREGVIKRVYKLKKSLLEFKASGKVNFGLLDIERLEVAGDVVSLPTNNPAIGVLQYRLDGSRIRPVRASPAPGLLAKPAEGPRREKNEAGERDKVAQAGPKKSSLFPLWQKIYPEMSEDYIALNIAPLYEETVLGLFRYIQFLNTGKAGFKGWLRESPRLLGLLLSARVISVAVSLVLGACFQELSFWPVIATISINSLIFSLMHGRQSPLQFAARFSAGLLFNIAFIPELLSNTITATHRRWNEIIPKRYRAAMQKSGKAPSNAVTTVKKNILVRHGWNIPKVLKELKETYNIVIRIRKGGSMLSAFAEAGILDIFKERFIAINSRCKGSTTDIAAYFRISPGTALWIKKQLVTKISAQAVQELCEQECGWNMRKIQQELQTYTIQTKSVIGKFEELGCLDIFEEKFSEVYTCNGRNELWTARFFGVGIREIRNWANDGRISIRDKRPSAAWIKKILEREGWNMGRRRRIPEFQRFTVNSNPVSVLENLGYERIFYDRLLRVYKDENYNLEATCHSFHFSGSSHRSLNRDIVRRHLVRLRAAQASATGKKNGPFTDEEIFAVFADRFQWDFQRSCRYLGSFFGKKLPPKILLERIAAVHILREKFIEAYVRNYGDSKLIAEVFKIKPAEVKVWKKWLTPVSLKAQASLRSTGWNIGLSLSSLIYDPTKHISVLFAGWGLYDEFRAHVLDAFIKSRFTVKRMARGIGKYNETSALIDSLNLWPGIKAHFEGTGIDTSPEGFNRFCAKNGWDLKCIFRKMGLPAQGASIARIFSGLGIFGMFRARLLEMYISEGCVPQRTGARFGIQANKIRSLMIAFGLRDDMRKQKIRMRNSLTEKKLKEIFESCGWIVADTTDKLKQYGSIRWKKFVVEFLVKTGRAGFFKRKLLSALKEKRMVYDRVGADFGVTAKTVKHWIKYLDLAQTVEKLRKAFIRKMTPPSLKSLCESLNWQIRDIEKELSGITRKKNFAAQLRILGGANIFADKIYERIDNGYDIRTCAVYFGISNTKFTNMMDVLRLMETVRRKLKERREFKKEQKKKVTEAERASREEARAARKKIREDTLKIRALRKEARAAAKKLRVETLRKEMKKRALERARRRKAERAARKKAKAAAKKLRAIKERKRKRELLKSRKAKLKAELKAKLKAKSEAELEAKSKAELEAELKSARKKLCDTFRICSYNVPLVEEALFAVTGQSDLIEQLRSLCADDIFAGIVRAVLEDEKYNIIGCAQRFSVSEDRMRGLIKAFDIMKEGEAPAPPANNGSEEFGALFMLARKILKTTATINAGINRRQPESDNEKQLRKWIAQCRALDREFTDDMAIFKAANNGGLEPKSLKFVTGAQQVLLTCITNLQGRLDALLDGEEGDIEPEGYEDDAVPEVRYGLLTPSAGDVDGPRFQGSPYAVYLNLINEGPGTIKELLERTGGRIRDPDRIARDLRILMDGKAVTRRRGKYSIDGKLSMPQRELIEEFLKSVYSYGRIERNSRGAGRDYVVKALSEVTTFNAQCEMEERTSKIEQYGERYVVKSLKRLINGCRLPATLDKLHVQMELAPLNKVIRAGLIRLIKKRKVRMEPLLRGGLRRKGFIRQRPAPALIADVPPAARRSPAAHDSRSADGMNRKTALSVENEQARAVTFRDTVIERATLSREGGKKTIIALGTGFIPGYNSKDKPLQYKDLNNLIVKMRQFCEDEDRGVRFIDKEDSKLAEAIDEAKGRKGYEDAKVIVLADENSLLSTLKDLRADQNVFMMGVDAKNLRRDSYIRIIEMLSIALEAGMDKEKYSVSDPPPSPNIPIKFRKGFWIFIPRSERMNIKALQAIYAVQRSA